MVAEVELVFNVEEVVGSSSDWASSYCFFIDRLRRSFPIPSWGDRHFIDLQFDVILRTKSHQTKLRISRSDFCLSGYQTENPCQWFWFGFVENHQHHSIQGSSYLEMSGTYDALERATDGQTIDRISIGRQQLVIAVNLLATSKHRQDQAWSLIVISLMICEGCRFPCITDYLATTFLDNLPPPTWMVKLVLRNWSDQLAELWQRGILDPDLNKDNSKLKLDRVGPPFRGALRRKKGKKKVDMIMTDPSSSNCPDPDRHLDSHDPDENKGITELETNEGIPGADFREDNSDADKHESSRKQELEEEDLDPCLIVDNPFLGLDPDEINADRQPSKDSHSDPVADTPFLHSGWPLGEIFSMRITDVYGKHRCMVYGIITVRDGASKEYICKQWRDESESVVLGDTVTLSIPSTGISALGDFCLAFSVRGINDICPLGLITWDDCCLDTYNELYCDEFYTEYCSMRVYYIALSRALQAAIEVTFAVEGQEGHARVYGRLSVLADYEHDETTLFQTMASESINACPGELFELLRSVVSIPMNSSLIIRAELYERVDACFDEEIAIGTMEFPIASVSEKHISMDCGKIRVRVNWA